MRCHRHSVLVIISFVLDFFFLFIGLQPQSLLRGARQIRTIVSEAMRSMDSRRKLKTYPKHQNILRDQQFYHASIEHSIRAPGATPRTILRQLRLCYSVKAQRRLKYFMFRLHHYLRIYEPSIKSFKRIIQFVRTPSKHELSPAKRHEYARPSGADRINNIQGSEMSKPFCSVEPRPITNLTPGSSCQSAVSEDGTVRQKASSGRGHQQELRS